MERISKPPEVRKREILDAAMKLFYEKGYEATSMADIAQKLNVVPGLCYRYFTSKQELFQAAMNQYVKECCGRFTPILHDQSKPYRVRMNEMAVAMADVEKNASYHDFYNKPGNEAFHEQLSIQMCKFMAPHVTQELTDICNQGKLRLDNPGLIAEFLLYGQMGLLQNRSEPYEKILKEIRLCIDRVLGL